MKMDRKSKSLVRPGWLALIVTAALVGIYATLFASGASALTDSELLFTIPGGGSAAHLGAGELGGPTGEAFDPTTGHIYVMDAPSDGQGLAGRIDEYTPWGEFVKAFGWDVGAGPVNEQQEILVRATSGAFTVGFEGSTTGELPYDVPGSEAEGAGSLEAALDGLPSISGAGGTVNVTRSAGTADGLSPSIYVIAFTGQLAGTDVAQMAVAEGSTPLSGGQPTELAIRTRADGSPTGEGQGACTAESGCLVGQLASGTADEKTQAGGALPGQPQGTGNIGVDSAGNVYLGYPTYVQKFNPAGRFSLSFGGDVIIDGAEGAGTLVQGSTTIKAVETSSRFFELGQTIDAPGLPPDTIITGVGPQTLTLSRPATTSERATLKVAEGVGNIPTNERQVVAIAPSEATNSQPSQLPSGGTFTLSFATSDPSPSNATTAALPLSATPAEVEVALASISNLSAGDVAVTGSSGGPWTVEFIGPRFGDSAPAPLTIDTGELTPPARYGEAVTTIVAPEVCRAAASCRRGVGSLLGNVSSGVFSAPPASGTPTGELAGIYTGLAVAPDGTVFVGDEDRIQRFDGSGDPLPSLPLPSQARGVEELALGGGVLSAVLLSPSNVNRDRILPGAYRLEPSSGGVEGVTPVTWRAQGASRGLIASDGKGNLFAAVENSETIPGNIAFGEQIEQFDSTGARLEPHRFATAPPSGAGYFEPVSMAGAQNGDIAVGLYGQELPGPTARHESELEVFGPSGNVYEAPPSVAPSFGSVAATSVTSTSASIVGSLNPHYWTDTRYHVEWGTGSCQAGGCGHETPAQPGSLLSSNVSGQLIQASPVTLEDLTSNTTYHFRMVAQSSGGGPTLSEEGTFSTFPPELPAKDDCVNQSFRTSLSAPLPDCRAYEMVSPVEKEGSDIKALLNLANYSNALDVTAADGERFTFTADRAFAGAQAAPFATQFLASRVAGQGWRTEALNPRTGVVATELHNQTNIDNQFKDFSSDLCQSWLVVAAEPAATEALENYPELYRREDCGAMALTPVAARPPNPPEVRFDLNDPEPQGHSADGRKLIFRTDAELTPDSGAAEPSRDYALSQVYYSDEAGLHLVCVLPDGSPLGTICSAGNYPAVAGLAGQVQSHNHLADLTHAISEDGSRVYWTAVPTENGSERAVKGGVGSGGIYLRINPGKAQSEIDIDGRCTEAEKACTLRVSELKSTSPARFLAASADGSRALYEFTEGTLKGYLYEYNLESESSTLIAKKALGLASAGASLEESYFVSEEVLGSHEAKAGAPNLFVRTGGANSFIATLSRTDVLNETNVNGAEAASPPSDVSQVPLYHAARAADDGGSLVFISTEPLTGYDNTDASSRVRCGQTVGGVAGLCDSEVFRFDLARDQLTCLSCNPTGARPVGQEVKGIATQLSPGLLSAATLPMPRFSLQTPRVISADGSRVFFDSFDALVPRDRNQAEDVYEWVEASSEAQCEAHGAELFVGSSGGCVSLISSGTGTAASELLDSSEDGTNAFFLTENSLLPQDSSAVDVYDARVNGGFAQVPRPQVCEGTDCQTPSAVPAGPTVGSTGARSEATKPKCKTAQHLGKGKKKNARRQACDRKKHKHHSNHKHQRKHKQRAKSHRRKRGGQRSPGAKNGAGR
jgi:hypothetical protein